MDGEATPTTESNPLHVGEFTAEAHAEPGPSVADGAPVFETPAAPVVPAADEPAKVADAAGAAPVNPAQAPKADDEAPAASQTLRLVGHIQNLTAMVQRLCAAMVVIGNHHDTETKRAICEAMGGAVPVQWAEELKAAGLVLTGP